MKERDIKNVCNGCSHRVGVFVKRCDATAEFEPVNGRRITPIKQLPTVEVARAGLGDCPHHNITWCY